VYPFFSGFKFLVVFIPGEDTLLNLSYTTFDHSSNFNVAMRDGFRWGLHKSGHLLFLDTASALNLLALSGLRVIDYEYTCLFAPCSLLSRLTFPIRYFLIKRNPWLLSKTLGGMSLSVIAITKLGLQEIRLSEKQVVV